MLHHLSRHMMKAHHLAKPADLALIWLTWCGAGVDPTKAGFTITSGFLPGGPIAKVLPMIPQDNIGFTGE